MVAIRTRTSPSRWACIKDWTRTGMDQSMLVFCIKTTGWNQLQPILYTDLPKPHLHTPPPSPAITISWFHISVVLCTSKPNPYVRAGWVEGASVRMSTARMGMVRRSVWARGTWARRVQPEHCPQTWPDAALFSDVWCGIPVASGNAGMVDV